MSERPKALETVLTRDKFIATRFSSWWRVCRREVDGVDVMCLCVEHQDLKALAILVQKMIDLNDKVRGA